MHGDADDCLLGVDRNADPAALLTRRQQLLHEFRAIRRRVRNAPLFSRKFAVLVQARDEQAEGVARSLDAHQKLGDPEGYGRFVRFHTNQVIGGQWSGP